ncbi:MAG: hypothetical protein HYX67_04355 [Candidatus Melainabacteria bacterium]|nr:hypothetical protein [Candidatus Melainabacteria bacterium]
MSSAIYRSQFLFAIAFACLGSFSSVAAQSTAPALRPPAQSVTDTTSTTTTTTTSTSTSTTTTGATNPAPPKVVTVSKKYSTTDVRSDRRTAVQMAKYHWLDKVAESDPGIIAAITTHYTAALELAKHPRIGEIAEADHYLCRRLTKWKTVARRLAKNGEADKVVALDPEGMYRAIRRDKATARRLVKNPMFDQMVYDNPDLGKLVAAYM